MLINKSLDEFIKLLSSDSPAPGGGSVAALCGSLSAALVCMVSNLTTNREKYAEYEENTRSIISEATKLIDELTNLIDKDAAAYTNVSSAYKLPRSTDEQNKARSNAIQTALITAASVPLETMKKAEECIALIDKSIGKTNPMLASDLGVAAVCADAAIKCAWLNVKINLSGISDEKFVISTANVAETIMQNASEKTHTIYDLIESKL